MKIIKAKFKSNTGASIILALLFLLFAMAVGSIILTAASVNLGRTTAMTNQEQNYQAVKSAASLIEKELSALTFNGEHSSTKPYDKFGNAGSSIIKSGSEKSEFSSVSGTVPDYAKDLILPELKNMYDFNNKITTIYAPTTATMELELDPNFPKVKANISVDSSYSIKVTFWCESDESNMLTLNAVANQITTDDVTYTNSGVFPMDEIVTHKTAVTYTNATIVKGGTK